MTVRLSPRPVNGYGRERRGEGKKQTRKMCNNSGLLSSSSLRSLRSLR